MSADNNSFCVLEGARDSQQSGKEVSAEDQSAHDALLKTSQRSAVATIVEPRSTKQQNTFWVWQVMTEFKPSSDVVSVQRAAAGETAEFVNLHWQRCGK